MKTTTFLLLIYFFSSFVLFGQGRKMQDIDNENLSDPIFSQSEQEKKTSAYKSNKRIIAISDSTFLISARILMNLDADSLRATNLKIEEEAMIFSEQFQFVFPNQRYKKYQAFLSSEIRNNTYRNRIREEKRKKTTWYYDGLNFSGYDKVIRPEKVRVGLQAVFELQLKYERKR